LKDPLQKLVGELIAARTLESDAEPGSPRTRIQQAALELFAERSYDATTTQAIAERAGTTERTLFKHFGSKDRLFAQAVFPAFLRALMPALMEPAAAELRARMAGDFQTTLRALLVDRIEVAVKHPAIFTMVWRELLTRPAFRSAFRMVFVERGRPMIDAFITAARDSGQLRKLPTDVVLRAIVGQLVAYLVTRVVLAPEQQWNTEADADRLLELIMVGIGGTAVSHTGRTTADRHARSPTRRLR
jgi:AcrR family transcriptional regulator